MSVFSAVSMSAWMVAESELLFGRSVEGHPGLNRGLESSREQWKPRSQKVAAVSRFSDVVLTDPGQWIRLHLENQSIITVTRIHQENVVTAPSEHNDV